MPFGKRLEMIFSMIPGGECLSDVGTDHGYIPIRAVQTGKVKRAIASDIGKGPLSRASEHILSAGLSDKIETRLGPGLSVLKKDEADIIVIAGMGGAEIRTILFSDPEIARSCKALILSPHKDAALLRNALSENGFRIFDEETVSEDGKYYPVISAVYDGSQRKLTEREAIFGPVNLEKRTESFRHFLENEEERLSGILSEMDMHHVSGNDAKYRKIREELLQVKKEKDADLFSEKKQKEE